MITFFISCFLALSFSILSAIYISEDCTERFWIFTAVFSLYQGAITTALSFYDMLNSMGWLIIQLLLTLSLVVILTVINKNGKSLFLDTSKSNLRIIPASDMISAFKSKGLLNNVLLFVIIVFIILSFLKQLLIPLIYFDEKMYHASRVLYWIQNQSIFPYVTHNDRQVVFTFGGELFFLWPVLFSKSEALGRIVFWLGYPLSALALYFCLSQIKLEKLIKLSAVLIFLATPIVIRYSLGLKPELWMTFYLLGTLFWVFKAYQKRNNIKKELFFSSIFLILCINTKSLAIIMIPSLFISAWLINPKEIFSNAIATCKGHLLAAMLSGLIVVYGFNLMSYHHFLGPEKMRKVHSSEISFRQIYTHAIRLPFLLMEFPFFPFERVRGRLGDIGNRIIQTLDADRPLPLEENEGWPGRFYFMIPHDAQKYSLFGIFWLPILLFGVYKIIKRSFSVGFRDSVNHLFLLLLFKIPLLAGIVFLVRWMVHSGLPERFLISPYSLGIMMAALICREIFAKNKVINIIFAVLIVYTISVPLASQLRDVRLQIENPSSVGDFDEPFSEAMFFMPGNARILFAGSQCAQDYPLFAPRNGFSNFVISWGKENFDNKRMENIIKRHHISHILIENDKMLDYHWDPPIQTSTMVDWLCKMPEFNELPLSTNNMRLFTTPFAKTIKPVTPEASTCLMEVPGSYPLVRIDPLFSDSLCVDPIIKTPWPVEYIGDNEEGFLWIGQGSKKGLAFELFSKVDRDVLMAFSVSPGPSRNDSIRNVVLETVGRQGTIGRKTFTFSNTSKIIKKISIDSGRTLFRFFALDEVTISIQPNGDTRQLIVGLHDIYITQLSEEYVDNSSNFAD